ncbi:HEXXH motif-containing putative peptide modification protein [Thermoactinomyces sp. CICC 10521]|uniref:aKG-HExxH-type peptide beta-hydroxylase n=1 Tax=Thermoactinomyces sp. CICC 10521 TaxID=2767426 RepID=UPI0018DE1C0F|nr:HEXXH motif-containing putative peptide modification protein [Thermoactinomyces sp. CICC 10521]MBH8608354.1 hypothetical protein [Thermoactinomyces sp. CICC 10521]
MMLAGLTWEQFFQEYWRKKPLFIKGGALKLLQTQWQAAEFEEMARQVEELDPRLVKRNANGLTFVQKVSIVNERLSELAVRFQKEMSCPSIWFDGVRANHGHSIGCHFDDSDNFVLQQEGVKIWKLHPPDIIADEVLQKRMLKNPDVGNIFMPDEYLEFILEPGDLLYIPIFWPHWGVSEGPSLSLSLVCNATNGLRDLLPLVSRQLAEDPEWWKPLPMMRLDEGGQDDEFDRMLERLLARMQEDSFKERVKSLWRKQRCRQVYGEAQEETNNRGNSRGGQEELLIDMDRVREIYGQPVSSFDLKQVVLPGETTAFNAFRELVFRVYLKRFLLVCSKGFPMLETRELKDSTQTLLTLLLQLDPKRLAQAAVRPELTSWIWRAHEAIDFGYGPRVEEIFSYLGTFFLPFFLQSDLPDLEGESLVLRRSTKDTIQLWPIGKQIHAAKGFASLMRVNFKNRAIQLQNDQETVEVPLETFWKEEGEMRIGQGMEITRLAVLRNTSAVICAGHDWYENFLPGDSKKDVTGLRQTCSNEERTDLNRCLDEGIGLVRAFWPEAFAELNEQISCILPLKSKGYLPYQTTIKAFRGMIATSARPSYLAAQTLVHETGHNKFNSVLDLYHLFENDPGVLFYSPFDDDQRPLTWIFHETFAFLQDIHISGRLLGAVEQIEDLSLERYLRKTSERVEKALDMIRKHARLTAEGERIVAGFEEALQKKAVK